MCPQSVKENGYKQYCSKIVLSLPNNTNENVYLQTLFINIAVKVKPIGFDILKFQALNLSEWVKVLFEK